MKTFVCNKLGHDKIFELCKQQGIEVDARILNDDDYKKALLEKLEEETQEVIVARDKQELLEELADVQEVIEALLVAHGLTMEQLQEVQHAKRERKGGFDEKIYINSFTVLEGSYWEQKFMSEPHKYKLKK